MQQFVHEFIALGLIVEITCDPQLERTFELVVPRSILDQPDHGARVDTVLGFEQQIAAVRTEVESANAETTGGKAQTRVAQQVLRRRR